MCLILLALTGFSQAQAQSGSAPPPGVEVNLDEALKDKQAAKVDAGGGVVLQLSAGRGFAQEILTFMDKGRLVKKLKDGKFMAYARLESGPATYWIIARFTGGAHCCVIYHFFARPEVSQPVRYLGETKGHDGEPNPILPAIMLRDGQLYFRDFDNRFDYFHASHAGSWLVNFPPRYYHLTPTSLRLSNAKFKDEYLKLADEMEKEISQEAGGRAAKPEAILEDWGEFRSGNFKDDLGQLLVKRTIALLYAREDDRAWETLERDVQKYYQTTKFLRELKRDILQDMRSAPY
jgi:hypothetical protein